MRIAHCEYLNTNISIRMIWARGSGSGRRESGHDGDGPRSRLVDNAETPGQRRGTFCRVAQCACRTITYLSDAQRGKRLSGCTRADARHRPDVDGPSTPQRRYLRNPGSSSEHSKTPTIPRRNQRPCDATRRNARWRTEQSSATSTPPRARGTISKPGPPRIARLCDA